MGITNYFKPKKAEAPAPAPVPMSEKPPANPYGHSAVGTPRNVGSSRASIAPSTRSSTMVDEIKHEVMVNFLHQQQCGHMWVADGSGVLEGVLLKKYRGEYLACPPQLIESEFAMACQALNVQVGYSFYMVKGVRADSCAVCHDCQFESYWDLPRLVRRRYRCPFERWSPGTDPAFDGGTSKSEKTPVCCLPQP